MMPGAAPSGKNHVELDVMTETRTQGKISRPKATPTVATRQRARFLVVGTAIAETILHQPGGEERRGLGGVAATIALALAEAGNEVTLITSIGQGPEGTRAKNLLGGRARSAPSSGTAPEPPASPPSTPGRASSSKPMDDGPGSPDWATWQSRRYTGTKLSLPTPT